VQQARNLVMDLGDRIAGLRLVIHDRDPLFTSDLREVFAAEGLRHITTLPRTPRMTAICERVIGSEKAAGRRAYPLRPHRDPPDGVGRGRRE
jgi:putative transposase